MSDPAHPPASSGGGSKVGNAWGFAILAIVVIFSGAIAMFASQLNSFLQVIKMNLGPILIIVAAAAILGSMKK